MAAKIQKTESQWREHLSEQQFQVTRKHATEPAFTGKYHDHHETGNYICVCCHKKLFHSDQKFESGTGWPSFTAPSVDAHIGRKTDKSFFMTRTEVHCNQCESHLGHVFNDGPADQGGLRYCINSASLDFVKDT